MDKVFCHSNNLEAVMKQISSWNISEQDKKKVPEFIKAYEIGKITGRRGTNPEGSMLRYLYFLKIGLEHIKGETKESLEAFLESLLKDKIKYNKANYALRSKRDILKILDRYLSWKSPSKAALFHGILNLKLAGKRNDISILNEDELKILVDNSDRPDKKYLVSVLASSGVRAEEFHNIRFSDWQIPKGKDMFVKLTIRNQFSKTKGRTIQLYDKWVLPAVKQYLAERIDEGIKPDEVVFKTTYYSNKKYLSRLGKKLLNKKIGYHLFRHTAATRLASKMNRQQLCNYFGWSYSSSMCDVYIQRSGINMADVDSKFTATEFEEQQKHIELQDKKIEEHELKFDKLLEVFENITKEMLIEKGIDVNVKKVVNDKIQVIKGNS